MTFRSRSEMSGAAGKSDGSEGWPCEVEVGVLPQDLAFGEVTDQR